MGSSGQRGIADRHAGREHLDGDMTMQGQIGFIALGDIGLPMTINLGRAGLAPIVYDLREEAMRNAALHGARPAE